MGMRSVIFVIRGKLGHGGWGALVIQCPSSLVERLFRGAVLPAMASRPAQGIQEDDSRSRGRPAASGQFCPVHVAARSRFHAEHMVQHFDSTRFDSLRDITCRIAPRTKSSNQATHKVGFAGVGYRCVAVSRPLLRTRRFCPAGTRCAGKHAGVSTHVARGHCHFLSILGAPENGAPLMRYPGLVYLGKISYGLYVFHMLSLRITDKLLSKYFAVSGLKWYAMRWVCAFGIALIFAAVSFQFLEKPFLRLKRRFTYVPSGAPI